MGAKPFTIMIGTDMHFISPDLIRNHELFTREEIRADGRVTHYSSEILDAFLDTVMEKKPDLLLLAGDLTYNGELQSHLEFARRLERVRLSGIPVVLIPGNHDICNLRASSFNGVTKEPVLSVSQEHFAGIYDRYGIGNCMERSPDSYSYVWELNENTWILCVDANKPDSVGIVTPDTLKWMEAVLEKAFWNHIRVIGVSHQNLVNQNSLIHNGYTMNNASKVRELYHRYCVTLNLSGHIHLQHQRERHGLTDIATGSLTLVPGRYGVLHFDGETFRYEKQTLDVEGWARANGIRNLDLQDFRRYSDWWYKKINVGKTMQKLCPLDAPYYTKLRLAESYVMLNQAYFSGDLEEICRTRGQEVKETYDLWREHAPDIFFTVYLKSMLEEYMEI